MTHVHMPAALLLFFASSLLPEACWAQAQDRHVFKDR